MHQLALIIHVLVAVAIVGLVLVQHGKGADVGASFGSGSANTMFGSQGHMPFLMKLTSVLAVIFFATSLTLGVLASRGSATNVLRTPVKQAPAKTQTFTLPKNKKRE